MIASIMFICILSPHAHKAPSIPRSVRGRALNAEVILVDVVQDIPINLHTDFAHLEGKSSGWMKRLGLCYENCIPKLPASRLTSHH